MYGIFFIKFKQYALSCLTEEVWSKIAEDAGISDKVYEHGINYPDNEIFSLVAAMASITEKDNLDILEEFGEYMSSYFLQLYTQTFNLEGKTTIELFESLKAESLPEIRKELANDIDVPFFDSERVNDKETIIMYESPRNLCAFIKGFIKGVGKQQNEDIFVEELECTMNGSTRCRFLIRDISDNTHS